MSISLIHNKYYAQFVSVHFLIQENVTLGLMFVINATLNLFSLPTTIHVFGLIKVTATITPVDSESKNYVQDKVETPGSSIQALQLLKLGNRQIKTTKKLCLRSNMA